MSKHKKFDFERIKDRAKKLRINMTKAEKTLWKELRCRKLSGFKFLRQHVFLYKGNLKRYNYFVADFYCYEKKAVIELDGPVHDTKEEYDEYRDSELQELGLRVLRIKNRELENMTEVLKKIKDFLDLND
ncbi:MAG: endonuclease domain-containing protein [Bacteroidota bacterium]